MSGPRRVQVSLATTSLPREHAIDHLLKHQALFTRLVVGTKAMRLKPLATEVANKIRVLVLETSISPSCASECRLKARRLLEDCQVHLGTRQSDHGSSSSLRSSRSTFFVDVRSAETIAPVSGFLTTSASLLRRAGLVTPRRARAAAAVEDLRPDAGEYTWIVRWSKTNREGAGLVVPVAGRAAEALRAWLDAAAITAGPVFRGIDRWEAEPVLAPIACQVGRRDSRGPGSSRTNLVLERLSREVGRADRGSYRSSCREAFGRASRAPKASDVRGGERHRISFAGRLTVPKSSGAFVTRFGPRMGRS